MKVFAKALNLFRFLVQPERLVHRSVHLAVVNADPDQVRGDDLISFANQRPIDMPARKHVVDQLIDADAHAEPYPVIHFQVGQLELLG